MTTFIYRQGDILASEAEMLVNPVNCVGVAGKGLALEFKKWYGNGFRVYKHACDSGELRIGTVKLYRTIYKDIVYFPTKEHWKDASRLEWIVAGLVDLRALLKRQDDVSSVAIPALGCGLGGLDWKDVRLAIVEALSGIEELTVYLYSPKENG